MITGFGNNVVSTLAADITAGQTTIQVMPGTGAKFAGLLSSDYANASNPLQMYGKITLTDAKETVFEICHLTSVNNDVLTVVRGQEGTAAKGWALNDVIANFATRGSENQFVQIEQLQSGQYISGVAGGTANALTIELPATYFVNGATDWVLRTPIVIYPTQNNTGASTLQLTMGGRVLGTFKLYKGNKAELVANDILKDTGLVCLLDNTKTFFSVMNPGAIYAGLGTAAFSDVQTSRDDTTPGRVLVNGGALAVHSFTATSGAGGTVTDANNLPSNSVNFVYSSAANSPGFESSILDFSGLGGGYSVQFSASYTQPGMFKLRTRNGDNGVWNRWDTVYTTGNKPTASDVGAVPILGGDVGYLNNASHFGTKSGMWEGAGAFQGQYTSPAAPFVTPGYIAPRDVSQYHPLIKGVLQTKDYGYAAAFSFGALTSGNATFPSAIITLTTDGGTVAAWSFNPVDRSFYSPGPVMAGGNINSDGDISGSYIASRGDITATGNIISGPSAGLYESGAGGPVRAYSPNNPQPLPHDLTIQGNIYSNAGIYEQGQRVYSPNNPQPAQDLSQYSTYDWVRQNFVTGMRQGSVVWSDRIFLVPIVPAGGAWVGASNNGSSDVAQMLPAYCPLQICINGNWFTISRM